MATLLTWSDRGVRPPPSHHRRKQASDSGPLLRLLDQPESQERYQRVVVLSSHEAQEPAEQLVKELRLRVPDVALQLVPLPDPSDYEQVFMATRRLLEQLTLESPVDVVLSAGTPQMQAVWLLLVKAGVLDARMLQVIPAAFVPQPHPRAIREVRLDFEGFPEIVALREEVERLRAEVLLADDRLVGRSGAIQKLRRLIVRVAASDVPIVVQGATGTGKELVSRAVHKASRRAQGPFVAENCAAFSDSVLQSELFGHERGAFTGAQQAHRGLFEQAHSGTLFLDEVAELSPRVQATLLRVLQEGTVRRLGGEASISVDVRLIVATHRDLRLMVREGHFREDLYYRIRGGVLQLPPLRERPGDIPLLVQSFLDELPKPLKVSTQVMRALARHDWPGNVRELRAEVIRWSVFCDNVVRLADLDEAIVGAPPAAPLVTGDVPAIQSLETTVRASEDAAIAEALEVFEGNLARTARALSIDRNTLKRKMKRMGLR